MSVLRRNVVANALGQSVGILSGFVLIPLYSRYLGHEGFGLVGFILSLQALTALLDLGLGAAANREVSRLSIREGATRGLRDLVRTLEYVYLAMALMLFASLALAAGYVAHHWLRTGTLETSVVRDSVVIAAAVLALRLQGALYHGVMRGLERQVRLNLVYAAIVGSQTVVTALVLILLRPGLDRFFAWQLALSVVEVAVLRTVTWRELRTAGDAAPRFSTDALRGVWRFALSVNGITVFAAGIKQLDKIVVSKLMTIGNLGYYSAATLVANGIGKVAVPFQTALFPRFSRLFANHDERALAGLFRDSVRLQSHLSCSVACGVAFFAHDILAVWMQSDQAAVQGARPLAILAAAMMLNGIMAPIFSLILAIGQTRIPLLVNGIGFAVLIPVTISLVERYGIAGAAGSWLAFNVAYYLVVPPLLARRWKGMSLPGFYLQDSLPYMLSSTVVLGSASLLAADLGPYARLAVGILSGIVCLAAGVALTPRLRRLARRSLGWDRA